MYVCMYVYVTEMQDTYLKRKMSRTTVCVCNLDQELNVYDLANRAAVRSLLSNQEAVVKVCSKALSLVKGKSGMTVSAPLAGLYLYVCMVCNSRAIIYK